MLVSAGIPAGPWDLSWPRGRIWPLRFLGSSLRGVLLFQRLDGLYHNMGIKVSRGRQRKLQDPLRAGLWNAHVTSAKLYWSTWIQGWRNRTHVLIEEEAVTLILQKCADTGGPIHWGPLLRTIYHVCCLECGCDV